MSADSELRNHAGELDGLATLIAGAFTGLKDAQVNWRPTTHDAKSIFVIATHALECCRAWVLHIVCRQPVGRDGAAEFSATRSASDIEVLARKVRAEIGGALASAVPERLGDRSVPPQELHRETPAHEISGRWALIHMVEHISVHLGQLQLTRDLAVREYLA